MKPQPLKLVIEHYRRLRDDSVAAQARVQIELTTAQRTLRTLDEYRQEQLQRARDSRRDAISTSQLLLQTRFTGKLDEAIALQKQRIAEIEHRIDACRAQVLGHQQRLKAIETVEDQRIVRAQDRAARADQAATDERAANAHARDVRQALDDNDSRRHFVQSK
jgi:flagellar export protein FliJ